MATQEEWRQSSYQRWLGTKGLSTGTMDNHYGLQEYWQKEKQRERAWQEFQPPTIPAYKPSASRPSLGSRAGGSETNWPAGTGTVKGGQGQRQSLGDHIAEMLDALLEVSSWMIARFPPARAIVKIGTELAESERRVKLAHAFISIVLIALYLYTVSGIPVGQEAWVGSAIALAVAGAVGWFFPLLLGGAIVLAIHLTAIALFLVAVMTGLAVIVRLFAMLAA